MGKRSRKQRYFEQNDESEKPEPTSQEDAEEKLTLKPDIEERPIKRGKWINKRRVLIFASRGISFRDRHLMNDLRTLMPHSKPDSKMEKKGSMSVINEICEMKNCDKCIFFENRKHKDLYMWISNIPNGPSAKFLVENVHTMEELKMTGNCLKASRPVLSFDENFNTEPHLKLLKEIFIQVFGTPRNHPKSQPFIDHVFNFAMLDNRIWFRNFQIEENGDSLVEIGPRFVLNLIKVFEGSFSGAVLFTNTNYITPSLHRRNLKIEASKQYKHKFEAKKYLAMRRPKESYKLDPFDVIFQTIPPEEAEGAEKNTFYRKKT